MKLSKEKMLEWKYTGIGWCPVETIRKYEKIFGTEMLRGFKQTIGGKRYITVVLF